MKHFRLSLLVCISLLAGSSALAQSTFLDLTIVESTNYNRPVGTFSYSNFEAMFKVMSNRPTVMEPDINRALTIFLSLLEPQKSYVIQHEPTYYFVFQFVPAENRYLVMNNSIGERNEAVFRNTFREAQREMLILLQTFYHNIPMIHIREHR